MKFAVNLINYYSLEYGFNYIPPLIYYNAQVYSVKHTGLVCFGHWR